MAVSASVFITTAAVRGGSTAVAMAASAMPAGVALPMRARRCRLILVDC